MRRLGILAFLSLLYTPVWGSNENTFSFNHQVGYESASQGSIDPLVGALLSRRYSPEMGRFFFEISDVNRRQEANNLAAEDLVFNALSSIPVVGGSITGGLVAGTGVSRSDSQGLAYGDSGSLSVSSSRIDFLFYRDPSNWERNHWPQKTKAAYEKLRNTYSDDQIKSAFRDAIEDSNAQNSPENLSYLHDQISLGRDGILGCDPTSNCKRFEGFHRVSISPPAKLPVPDEISDRLTSLGSQISDIERRLESDSSLAATDRSLLHQELRGLRDELRDIIEAEKVAEKLLMEQRNALKRIEEQTAPQRPSEQEIERLEVDEMLSNPLSIGGIGVYAPKEIRDELRLAGEAVRSINALQRLGGASADAQKFIVTANTVIQVTGAVSTISKLSSGNLTAKKGAMMLASSTTIIGAVGVAMELFSSNQQDPTQVALQQIMELLGKVLENQRIIIQKLEGIEAGQDFIIHQLVEISAALDQLQVGQRDLGISIINELNQASCERHILSFDLSSRIDLVSSQLQLNELHSIMRELAPETIMEIRAAGRDYVPGNEKYLKLIEELLLLKQALERVNAVAPPRVIYKNPFSLDSNASEADFVAGGKAAHRLHACGSTEVPSHHERRGAVEEIFAGLCNNNRDCSKLSTGVDGVMLQDLMAVYLKASDALLQSDLGTNALNNDVYGLRQLFRARYEELHKQEELARQLLPVALDDYQKLLDEIEHWIRYAIQIDVASVISGGSGIGWSQKNSELGFEEYLAEAELTLRTSEVYKALFENFWVRAKVAEYLGLGRVVSNPSEQLRYYWHAANWDQDGVDDFWRVAGYLSSENWFSFDVERMRPQLDSVGVGQAALNRFLNERRLFTSRNANKFLLDGQFRFTQFRSIKPFRTSAPDYSRGYHHSNCWDFLGHKHLFRPGSVSTGTMPTADTPVWRNLSPPTDRQVELYQRYLQRSCALIPGRARAPDESLIYYHNANNQLTRSNIHPESYNTAHEAVSEMINFSRNILIAAIHPFVEDSLAVTRDDWEAYVVNGAHSTSIPDYMGWYAVPFGYDPFGRRGSEEENIGIDVLQQAYGTNGYQQQRGLLDHRNRIHSGARKALSKLSAARLAVLTALELGYGEHCIKSNLSLSALHTSTLQGLLVSGEELRSVNPSKSEGRMSLQRLLFSKELIAAIIEEFNPDETTCNIGYYASSQHLEILKAFESGLSDL